MESKSKDFCQCKQCKGKYIRSKNTRTKHLKDYGHMDCDIDVEELKNVAIDSHPVQLPVPTLIEKKIIHKKTNNNQIYEFILEVMKIYVNNKCTEKVITDFLKVLRLCPFIPQDISLQFPENFKNARTFLELNPKSSECKIYYLCTNNCSVIEDKDSDSKCEVCETSTYHPPKENSSESKLPIPRSIFYHFPIRSKIKWLWSVPEIATNLHILYKSTLEYISLEDKKSVYIDDIFKGQMWVDFAVPELKKNPYSIFISLTNDPAGLTKDKTMNFTPWLIKFMNLNVITRRKLMVMIGLSYRTKETKVDKEQRAKIKKKIMVKISKVI